MRRNPRRSSLFLALLAASCSAIGPVDRGPSLPQERQRPAFERPWSVAVDATAFDEADLDDSGGDVSVTRFGATAKHKLQMGSVGVALKLEHEQSEYDFGGGGGVLDPFDDASETSVGANAWGQASDEVSWFGILKVIDGTDDDADFGDGVYVKGGGGFLYKTSETLQIGLGVFGRSRLEEDADFTPFPVIEWRIDERHRIGTVRTADPGLGYTYAWRDGLEGFVSIQFLTRQYRVDEDTIDDAAFVDQERSLRGGLIWDRDNGFKGELFVGVAERELSLDVDDDELVDDDVDPAAVIGFSLTYAF